MADFDRSGCGSGSRVGRSAILLDKLLFLDEDGIIAVPNNERTSILARLLLIRPMGTVGGLLMRDGVAEAR